MDTVDRHLQPRLERALERSRVVMLHGARQCGKTTLAQLLVKTRGGTYISLDDEIHRQALLDDPMTYLASQQRPLVIDEVQLGGDRVVRSIKTTGGRRPGPRALSAHWFDQLLDGFPTSVNPSPDEFNSSACGHSQKLELTRTRADIINCWFQGDPGRYQPRASPKPTTWS